MSYIFKAIIRNSQHPEYGVATIPFPIPRAEYDHVVDLLQAMEIGHPVNRDCNLIGIDSYYSILNRIVDLPQNLDELDYLAKRLESFVDSEAVQFQAMAYKLELFEVKDLINLTFCCQQTTVISDFSDLEQVGKDHYFNLHGGCVSSNELENLDGVETAHLLIAGGNGTVTPYGVVYDNGMKLEKLYRGREFPAYLYESCVMAVAMTTIHKADCEENTTWLFLPAAEQQIQRAMRRAGIESEDYARFRLYESELPEEIDAALDFEQESIFELNRLCQSLASRKPEELKKLEAVVRMAQPKAAYQIRQLAENLELFDFIPNIRTPEEYGKYMIKESGRYDYDCNLEGFYDYAGYAQARMQEETGAFNLWGYVAYHGPLSLDELMMETPAEQDFQMGEIKL